MLPRIPAVQSWLGAQVSTALSKKLGTDVSVGNVELRLPSRVIVDNLNVLDQSRKDMLQASRVTVSIDLLPLLNGQIRISSAQLFGMKAHLTQKDASSPLNCQFLIDSLKSKDTLSTTPLDLRISSLIIRNSSVSYRLGNAPIRQGTFTPDNIHITDLSSHIMLNHLTDDTLDINVKRLRLKERSGLDIRHLTFALIATGNKFTLNDFTLRLPQSEISTKQSTFAYTRSTYNPPLPPSTSFQHNIDLKGSIVPSNLACLFKGASADNNTYNLSLTSDGTERNTQTHLTLRSTHAGINGDICATLHNILNSPDGDITVSNLRISEPMLRTIAGYGINIPRQILALGDVSMDGKAHLFSTKHIKGNADISTTKAGKASISGEYTDGALNAHLITDALNLAQLTDDKSLGNLSSDIHVNTLNIRNPKQHTTLNGTIKEFTYNNYTYHDIRINGKLTGNIVSGLLDVNDRNIILRANGTADIARKSIINATVDLNDFSPSALHLTKALGDTPVNASLRISPTAVQLDSDIADLRMDGSNINLSTLPHDVMQIIAAHMPASKRLFPKAFQKSSASYGGVPNDFTVSMKLKDPSALRALIPQIIEIPEDATLHGNVNATTNSADLTLAVPTLLVSGQKFNGTSLRLYTTDTTIQSQLSTDLMDRNGPVELSLHLEGKADHLHSVLAWDNRRDNAFKGQLTTKTQFFPSPRGTAFRIAIPKSDFLVGDSLWTIQSDEIRYEDGAVGINHLYVGNSTQSIALNGVASSNPSDSLLCRLSNVDVSYILNLVNFHSVSFGGIASGTFSAKGVLGDMTAGGHLDVSRFLFEQGNLGTLHLDAAYSSHTKRITLDGICDDSPAGASTMLSGYVVPSPGEILLDIQADNTRLEFVETFCKSFMQDSNLRGTGNVRLFGPFSNVNLEGKLVADGAFTLTSTNCRYTLPHDTVTFIPDDIQFHDAILIDKLGNRATLTGGVHHQHLTRMSYDLNATTTRLLAYDFPQLRNDETFCGYAVINGDIGIHGKGNELIISADATPLEDTFLTYNASSPEAIRSGDIITWRSTNPIFTPTYTASSTPSFTSNSTNIHMDFLVHANPNAKLHLIMDETTGDYIDLFGNGDLRVNYFNKGGLDIFGNYVTDHGLYKMTIQNLLRRDFTFRKGGTITFGGDPYDALLNMQAQYSLASVPLADLNIGSTLTSGNVPVNCLMNITGTPGKPSVAFGLDLPSLSTDARQMVNSVINSAEEMNQQVLYLLAIGRFYAPSDINTQSGGNNGYEREVSQSTLAVQSFLSGTLSQQFNNMMSNVMGNLLGSGNTFSFGANIAPGNEGFSNAEYEGLLSGRLFNNRLLFNGQFGYRDNINTNSQSFIGDFTLQYLLTKNGNISLKVYNQTNDRYFTRNSLNTQGIGIVFQKEFGK